MAALNPRVVAPGHGPVADIDGITATKTYLEHMVREIRRCHEAGLSVTQAARAVQAGPYAHLAEPERLVVNVDAFYRFIEGREQRSSAAPYFKEMAAFLGRA
jgi:cyclase